MIQMIKNVTKFFNKYGQSKEERGPHGPPGYVTDVLQAQNPGIVHFMSHRIRKQYKHKLHFDKPWVFVNFQN